MSGNIVLIGMPGAGKSTVGVVLAKALGYGFIDTDILLARRLGVPLQKYIDRRGLEAFLKAEEQTALSLSCSETVVATGGSMVLSDPAMQHLKRGSTVVFLDLPLAEISRRLKNFRTRGIAMQPGQTVSDVYRQRRPLYLAYADITVPEKKSPLPELEETVEEIALKLRQRALAGEAGDR